MWWFVGGVIGVDWGSEEEVEGEMEGQWREMRGRKGETGERSSELHSLCTATHFLTPHSREAPQETGFRPRETQSAFLGARAWYPLGLPSTYAMCPAAAWAVWRRIGRRGMKTFQASRICWRSTRGLTECEQRAGWLWWGIAAILLLLLLSIE